MKNAALYLFIKDGHIEFRCFCEEVNNARWTTEVCTGRQNKRQKSDVSKSQSYLKVATRHKVFQCQWPSADRRCNSCKTTTGHFPLPLREISGDLHDRTVGERQHLLQHRGLYLLEKVSVSSKLHLQSINNSMVRFFFIFFKQSDTEG